MKEDVKVDLADDIPPAAKAIQTQTMPAGQPYVGAYPTAYHPHGDYTVGPKVAPVEKDEP